MKFENRKGEIVDVKDLETSFLKHQLSYFRNRCREDENYIEAFENELNCRNGLPNNTERCYPTTWKSKTGDILIYQMSTDHIQKCISYLKTNVSKDKEAIALMAAEFETRTDDHEYEHPSNGSGGYPYIDEDNADCIDPMVNWGD
jgi:hypothetical protein